jgi:hypothetical protein
MARGVPLPDERPVRQILGQRIGEDGSTDEIVGSVYRARPDDDAPSWNSIVDCPVIDPPTTQIYGVDGEQAEDLAEQFIRTLFEHHGYRITEVRTGNGQT